MTVATPHTRGSTPAQPVGQSKVGGYPAYAGIDPSTKDSQQTTARLPRIRGDRPSPLFCGVLQAQATPHTRGSTITRIAEILTIGGYPAYAGIDLDVWLASTASARLPRIRGDRP